MLNAQRLKLLRKSKGLRQVDVANSVNIERTTYVRYEKGEIQPPTDIVVKLANLLDTTTDYLLSRIDNPNSLKKEQTYSLSTEEALQIWATEQSFSKKDLEYLRDTIRLLGNKNKIEEFSSEFANDNTINRRVIPKFN